MLANRLRHSITIEQPSHTQDPDTGEMLTGWSVYAQDVRAAIQPLSAREFIAAQAGQTEIDTRITIRYRDVTPAMRVVHRGRIYNIKVTWRNQTGVEHSNTWYRTLEQDDQVESFYNW